MTFLQRVNTHVCKNIEVCVGRDMDAQLAQAGLGMDWGLYRYFLAVAESGSLSAAARQLGVSQPTVGRQIQELEARLNTRLFDRLSTGYSLTPSGKCVVDLARNIEVNAVAIERKIAGVDQKPAGLVCLCAPEGLGNAWLMPKIALLRERYPEIEVELVISMGQRDLGRREADIALRVGKPGDDSLVGRRISAVGFGLFASRDYAARRGIPETPRDLAGHCVIESIGPLATLPQVQRLRDLSGESSCGFACSNLLVQFTALKTGLGLLPIPYYMAHGHPDLLHVLPDDFHIEMDLWLLTHRDLKATARIRAVMDFLAGEVLADRDLLVGA